MWSAWEKSLEILRHNWELNTEHWEDRQLLWDSFIFSLSYRDWRSIIWITVASKTILYHVMSSTLGSIDDCWLQVMWWGTSKVMYVWNKKNCLCCCKCNSVTLRANPAALYKVGQSATGEGSTQHTAQHIYDLLSNTEGGISSHPGSSSSSSSSSINRALVLLVISDCLVLVSTEWV